MSKRFILTILTLVIMGLATGIAVFFAKGYRLSTSTGTVAGTGIISVTSKPDQASIYLDDHLTSATPSNINSLPPKSYKVRIVKDGFIPWEKTIDVHAGLVTDIKATLYPAIPSVYPLTYGGVEQVLLSPDEQRVVYIIPSEDNQNSSTNKKSGVWVWEMSDRPIGFSRGREPHQVALPDYDYTKSILRWSPDSSQIMVIFEDRTLLLDANRFNDPPRDITATFRPLLQNWQNDEAAQISSRIATIESLNIRNIASASATLDINSIPQRNASTSAYLKWSPDESKILIASPNKSGSTPQPSQSPLKQPIPEQTPSATDLTYQVYDLLTGKQYSLSPSLRYSWLADSEHLVAVKEDPNAKELKRVSIIEFDGTNEAIIYAGRFNPHEVFPWPDGSRLVVVTSLNIPTASAPNLFGINLK